MSKRKIYIGTSGWNYDDWDEDFYSKSNGKEVHLQIYANHFNTVELNSSFYHLPSPSEIQDWRKKTPKTFLFSCKANRYITHMKKLSDPKEPINHLLKTLKHFEQQLGPVLFQLPPYLKLDLERLNKFINNLPNKYHYTFEFRNKSWFCDKVYELLQKNNITLCFYDFKGYQSPEIITSDLIYVRLHGPEKEPYQGRYDGRTLAGYAQKFLNWQEEGKSIFCYFDNTKSCAAPYDAKFLLGSLSRQS
ncbi:DUF72 domain-containing protein [Legionella impletisoli]|uniref:DUF72 domain-containing protein n=1 Tax=Legionella impletisoli TaxID=343510 RepID=A0A917JLN4_9GAMM|nr:DUF72 domain-containing protein [Legionella impletisoli]GGI76322.1 hypothetical protein GCM10007966_01420 [Legionella impletisoli]